MARRVELNYAAAAALAAESQIEQHPSSSINAIESARRDAARVEADDAAAAREWTRRLIESGSATSRDDDDSDLDAHQWGGDAEIFDDKVVLIAKKYVLLSQSSVQGAPILRVGRASDVLLRLLVCEHDLRSAAADAKVSGSSRRTFKHSSTDMMFSPSALNHTKLHRRLTTTPCALGNWAVE